MVHNHDVVHELRWARNFGELNMKQELILVDQLYPKILTVIVARILGVNPPRTINIYRNPADRRLHVR